VAPGLVLNLDAVERATAEWMLGHLVAGSGRPLVATAAGETGDASETAAPAYVGRIALLGASKAVAKAATARGPRREHSLERPFEELFAAQVTAPERVAVVCELALPLMYSELAARARMGRALEWEKGGKRGYDGSNSNAEELSNLLQ